MDKKSILGYSKGSPYRNMKSIMINTPQGLIDMSNTDVPILGTDETGMMKMMMPYSGMHKFRGKKVNEVPMAQKGLNFLQPNDSKLKKGYVIPFSTPSTELATSIGGENGEPAFLIPSFKYGKLLEDPLAEFIKSGDFLGGPFKTWQEADEWEKQIRHPFVEKGQSIPSPYRLSTMQRGGLTPQKAHEMLIDGTAHGKKLTPAQKRYFGMIYGNSKKQMGGMQMLMDFLWEDDELPKDAPTAPSSSELTKAFQRKEQQYLNRISQLENDNEVNYALSVAEGDSEEPTTYRSRKRVGVGLPTSPTASSVPTANIGKKDTNDKAKYAFNYYISKGLAPEVAAGIVGNLMHESGLNPTITGDGGKAKGIAQWHPDRWSGLEKWATTSGRDPNALETQLDYILQEPGESDKVLNKLKNAKNSGEAAMIFSQVYERPGLPAYNSRVGYARSLHPYQRGGSIVAPYRPVPQSDNTSLYRPAYISPNDLAINKELARQQTAKVVAKRKANIAEANEARNASSNNIVQWADNFGKTTQALGDKFRTSLKPNFFDDYINPLVWLGDMGKDVGQVPMNLLMGNTQASASAVATPILMGVGEKLGEMGISALANKFRPKSSTSITRGFIDYSQEPNFRARNPNFNHNDYVTNVTKFGNDIGNLPKELEPYVDDVPTIIPKDHANNYRSPINNLSGSQKQRVFNDIQGYTEQANQAAGDDLVRRARRFNRFSNAMNNPDLPSTANPYTNLIDAAKENNMRDLLSRIENRENPSKNMADMIFNNMSIYDNEVIHALDLYNPSSKVSNWSTPKIENYLRNVQSDIHAYNSFDKMSEVPNLYFVQRHAPTSNITHSIYDKTPIITKNDWMYKSSPKEFGMEMRGSMENRGLNPNDINEVEKFRQQFIKEFNQREMDNFKPYDMKIFRGISKQKKGGMYRPKK